MLLLTVPLPAPRTFRREDPAGHAIPPRQVLLDADEAQGARASPPGSGDPRRPPREGESPPSRPDRPKERPPVRIPGHPREANPIPFRKRTEGSKPLHQNGTLFSRRNIYPRGETGPGPRPRGEWRFPGRRKDFPPTRPPRAPPPRRAPPRASRRWPRTRCRRRAFFPPPVSPSAISRRSARRALPSPASV
jgi:hypothetical protein